MRELNTTEIDNVVGASNLELSWLQSALGVSQTVGNFAASLMGNSFFNTRDVSTIASSLFINTVGNGVSFVGKLVDDYIPDCIIDFVCNAVSFIGNVGSFLWDGLGKGIDFISSLFGNK